MDRGQSQFLRNTIYSCDFRTKLSLRLGSQIQKLLYLSYSTPASPTKCPLLAQKGLLSQLKSKKNKKDKWPSISNHKSH